jgi:hypothetical protein
MYRASSGTAQQQIVIIHNPVAITTVISGLMESKEYVFQVLAFTIKDGPPSNSL